MTYRVTLLIFIKSAGVPTLLLRRHPMIPTDGIDRYTLQEDFGRAVEYAFDYEKKRVVVQHKLWTPGTPQEKEEAAENAVGEVTSLYAMTVLERMVTHHLGSRIWPHVEKAATDVKRGESIVLPSPSNNAVQRYLFALHMHEESLKLASVLIDAEFIHVHFDSDLFQEVLADDPLLFVHAERLFRKFF
jgi:hypothetical protein